MALLNYASTAGLAYKHDFKQWNDETARQEQLTAQKQQNLENKSQWIADKMKLGKVYTEHDSKELKNLSRGIFEKMGSLLKGKWASDPMVMAQFSEYSNELLDNDVTRRSSRVHEEHKRLLQDMSNPDYANDEYARADMEKALASFQNYSKVGNPEGIEGAASRDFTYTSPQLFDATTSLNELAKNIGTEQFAYENSTGSGVKTMVKDFSAITSSELSGKRANQWEREYQKRLAAGHTSLSKTAWFTEEIKARKDLQMTYHKNPERTGRGNGNGKDDYPLESRWNMYAAVEVQMRANQSMQNGGMTAVFSDINNIGAFASGYSNVDGAKSISIGTNGGAMIIDDTGKWTNLKSLSGSVINNPTVTNRVAFLNGRMYNAVQINQPKNNEEIAGLVSETNWYGGKRDEIDNDNVLPQFKNSIKDVPRGTTGEADPTNKLVTVWVPSDMSAANQDAYEVRSGGQAYGNDVFGAKAQDSKAIMQDRERQHIDLKKYYPNLQPGQMTQIKHEGVLYDVRNVGGRYSSTPAKDQTKKVPITKR